MGVVGQEWASRCARELAYCDYLYVIDTNNNEHQFNVNASVIHDEANKKYKVLFAFEVPNAIEAVRIELKEWGDYYYVEEFQTTQTLQGLVIFSVEISYGVP